MKKNKIIVIILVLAILFIIYRVLSYCYSPKYLVKEYINAYNNSDCKTLYKLTYITSRKNLTSFTNFEPLCKSNINKMKKYQIRYFDKYAIVKSDNKELRIDFIKTSNKKFLIFDEYLLKSNVVNILSNIEIIVPSELSSLKIGNTFILDYDSENIDDIYDKIILGDVFENTYELIAKYGEKTYKKNIHISEEVKTQQIEFENEPINIYLFSNPNCHFCQGALSYLNKLKEGSYQKYFNLIVYDINDDDTLYNKMSTQFNRQFDGVPLMIIGDDYVLGYNSSNDQTILKKIMHAYRIEAKDIIKGI